jgi:hypothetical protein
LPKRDAKARRIKTREQKLRAQANRAHLAQSSKRERVSSPISNPFKAIWGWINSLLKVLTRRKPVVSEEPGAVEQETKPHLTLVQREPVPIPILEGSVATGNETNLPTTLEETLEELETVKARFLNLDTPKEEWEGLLDRRLELQRHADQLQRLQK